MIAKRKRLTLFCGIILILFTVTSYLLITKVDNVKQQTQVSTTKAATGKTHQHKTTLQPLARIDRAINSINNPTSESAPSLWKTARSWLGNQQITDFDSPQLGAVLAAMRRAKITKADLNNLGTQLKLQLTLEGGQKVIFKPQWYTKETVIEGNVYAGKDRHYSEIIAFYLSILLDLPFVPPSTERSVHFDDEILPVATQRLLDTTYKTSNSSCLYGACYYCRKRSAICTNSTNGDRMKGAVIMHVNGTLHKYVSPWVRTYKKDQLALWQTEGNYCNKNVKPKMSRKRILDLIDAAIFDFLIQNGDRHNYETFQHFVVLLDNGKGFGNPNKHFFDILAPLHQCCMLRKTTHKQLQSLGGGVLIKKLLQFNGVLELVTERHLVAVGQRLEIVFNSLKFCRQPMEFV